MRWAMLILMLALVACTAHDDHWSMVYEAIQTPETPGGQKRFVLFNEDGLTRLACIDVYDEYLRRLNNNAAVIEYVIECAYLQTKGHGYLFQTQDNWLLP